MIKVGPFLKKIAPKTEIFFNCVYIIYANTLLSFKPTFEEEKKKLINQLYHPICRVFFGIDSLRLSWFALFVLDIHISLGPTHINEPTHSKNK